MLRVSTGKKKKRDKEEKTSTKRTGPEFRTLASKAERADEAGWRAVPTAKPHYP